MPKQRYRMVIVKAARRRAIVPDGQNTSECFRDLRKLGLGPQWDVRNQAGTQELKRGVYYGVALVRTEDEASLSGSAWYVPGAENWAVLWARPFAAPLPAESSAGRIRRALGRFREEFEAVARAFGASSAVLEVVTVQAITCAVVFLGAVRLLSVHARAASRKPRLVCL